MQLKQYCSFPGRAVCATSTARVLVRRLLVHADRQSQRAGHPCQAAGTRLRLCARPQSCSCPSGPQSEGPAPQLEPISQPCMPQATCGSSQVRTLLLLSEGHSPVLHARCSSASERFSSSSSVPQAAPVHCSRLCHMTACLRLTARRGSQPEKPVNLMLCMLHAHQSVSDVQETLQLPILPSQNMCADVC